MRTLALALLISIPFAAAAQDRKPGLYDLTITTTTVSPSAQAYPPRTSQACLTQEMIDKYGAIVPQNLTRACQFVNIVKKRGGMTADMVCTSGITGKGTLEVNWSDAEHAKGTLHFSGTMHPSQTDIKIEWTATTASAYKGPDCGALAPTPPAPPTTPAPTAPAKP
jgi:predicted GH43/DUF377 family glycosyl hydrolase